MKWATEAARIVDAATAGVAFIAAGAIIKSQGDVKGARTGVGLLEQWWLGRETDT